MVRQQDSQWEKYVKEDGHLTMDQRIKHALQRKLAVKECIFLTDWTLSYSCDGKSKDFHFDPLNQSFEHPTTGIPTDAAARDRDAANNGKFYGWEIKSERFGKSFSCPGAGAIKTHHFWYEKAM